MADLAFVNYQSRVLRIVFFCLINYLIWSGMLIQINDYFLTPLKLSLESPRIASPKVWLTHILTYSHQDTQTSGDRIGLLCAI